MESAILQLKATIVELTPQIDKACGKTQCEECVMCCDEGCAWINLRDWLGV